MLALTWMKVPAGGLVSPLSVYPQQSACPVVLIPQTKAAPALMDPTPGGADAAVSEEVIAADLADAGPSMQGRSDGGRHHYGNCSRHP